MANGASGNGRSGLSVILLIAQVVVVPLIGWLIVEGLSMRDRVTRIEASRFTAEDGNAFRRDIATTLEDIRGELTGLKLAVAKIPTQIPPAWFEREVRALRGKIEDLAEEVGRLRKE